MLSIPLPLGKNPEELHLQDQTLLQNNEVNLETDLQKLETDLQKLECNTETELRHSKLINCNIYGSVRVSPLALKIINTPEFQRLRYIKQLGLCYHVYPSAIHTRFEHSIGVYHLASVSLNKLQRQYPNKKYQIKELNNTKIKLNDKIAECIKIAALCHDIGHGPLSHCFDTVFLANVDHPNKHHEIRSCLITELLCKRELRNELSDQQIEFIKSVINPSPEHTGVLYQIVANKMNGIDIDKFDYLIRDSKNTGLKIGFNPSRLINEFIIDQNNNIAYPKHCSIDIYELFYGRYIMHKKIYTHKTVKIIELMINELYLKIDSIYGISETIKDMNLFCKLTDSTIFQYITYTINPPSFMKIILAPDKIQTISEAYNIYQNILSRNFYWLIMDTIDDNGDIVAIKFEKFLQYLLTKYSNFKKEDFIITKIQIGLSGNNKIDPFKHIYFYNKKEDNRTFILDKKHISGLVNNRVYETHWYMICKKREIRSIVISELEKFIT